MRIIERGAGDPVVVIPGIQGRWPYVGPTVDALASRYRVLTYSLAGEPGGRPFAAARGLDNFAGDLDALFDVTGLASAVLVGVSFGGVVALRYAAAHPARVRALVLVSAPGPGWTPAARQRRYMSAPRLFGWLFLLEAPLRVGREIRVALPAWRDRARFSLRQIATFLRAPFSFTRLALRASLAAGIDTTDEARRVTAPTLVVTGEPALDRVVPVEGTRQYGRLVPGARTATLAGTGHLGSLSQAPRFAAVIFSFIDGLRHAAA
jgi:pimeloyl-ACP methyl ester carboxylesterase